MSDKLTKTDVMELAALSDDVLDVRIASAAARLTLRADRFAHELASGTPPRMAAERCGLSTRGGNPWSLASRPHVAGLVRLLRERARRRAAVTTVDQIIRFQGLSQKAEDAGELSTAVAAEREVGKLAGLYQPEGVGVTAGVVDIRINFGPPPPSLPSEGAASQVIDVTPDHAQLPPAGTLEEHAQAPTLDKAARSGRVSRRAPAPAAEEELDPLA